MIFPFVYVTDLHQLNSPAIIEIAKVLLVSVGWIGGLAVFVYWKDKQSKKLVSSPST